MEIKNIEVVLIIWTIRNALKRISEGTNYLGKIKDYYFEEELEELNSFSFNELFIDQFMYEDIGLVPDESLALKLIKVAALLKICKLRAFIIKGKKQLFSIEEYQLAPEFPLFVKCSEDAYKGIDEYFKEKGWDADEIFKMTLQ